MQYYSKLKVENNSITEYGDSTIFITHKAVDRFTDDTSRSAYGFMFYNKNPDSFHFVKSDEYGGLESYRPEKYYFINLLGDTLIRENVKPFNFDRRHSSSRFYSLNCIPTKSKNDFSILAYTLPKLVSEYMDTVVLSQIDRKWKDERLLYFTKKDYRVFKVILQNKNLDRPDAYSSFEIEYFSQNCFDSINEVHNLRGFHKKEYSSKYKYSEDERKYSKDTVFLQKDSFITDFDGKFFLLDYWYLGCSPCLKMMPFMKNLQEEIDDTKLIILGINPYDKEFYVQRYLKDRGYNTFQMDIKKMKPYHNVNEFPQLILVDKNMKDVKVFKGYGKGVSDLEIKLYLKSMNLLK